MCLMIIDELGSAMGTKIYQFKKEEFMRLNPQNEKFQV